MNSSKQQGLTFIGLIFVLALIGMIVLSALKVVPIYMEHFAVQTSVESIIDDPKLKSLTVREIKILLHKKLNINGVTSVNSGDAKIRKSGGEIAFSLEYEVRKDYIGNIDIVLSFSDEFNVDLNAR